MVGNTSTHEPPTPTPEGPPAQWLFSFTFSICVCCIIENVALNAKINLRYFFFFFTKQTFRTKMKDVNVKHITIPILTEFTAMVLSWFVSASKMMAATTHAPQPPSWHMTFVAGNSATSRRKELNERDWWMSFTGERERDLAMASNIRNSDFSTRSIETLISKKMADILQTIFLIQTTFSWKIASCFD